MSHHGEPPSPFSPRIKGSHNAILSGMLAAEHLFEAVGQGRAHDEVASYEEAWRGTDIGYDLYRVRNVKPLWSRYGTLVGIGLGGIDMWLSQLTGLSPFGTLSHGNRQKLGLIQAFMHRPDLVVLDEPTQGLDPLVQRVFLDLVREHRDGGGTVFLSSHVLSEVEAVADEVGILAGGRLVRQGTLAELGGGAATSTTVRSPDAARLVELLTARGLPGTWVTSPTTGSSSGSARSWRTRTSTRWSSARPTTSSTCRTSCR